MDGGCIAITSYARDERCTLWLRQQAAILRNNPDFGLATCEYAAGIVKVFEGQYLANKVMANAARQVICTAILALYHNRDRRRSGVAMTCLQRVTSALGLCSKSTTALTVDLLERIGHVTRIQDELDHRSLLIQPTGLLVSCVQDIVRVSLSAADRMFPARQYRAFMQGDGDLLERYFVSSLKSLLNTDVLVDHHASRLFANSDSGQMLLCKLMSSRQSHADTLVNFPFEEIANLYGVSRTHIRRLMKVAEAEGLVRLHERGGRRVEILPPLTEMFGKIVASHIAKVQFDIHLANEDCDLLPVDLCA
ncbi:hypothetical protein [Phyllobacterium sp. SB3]|uniref:hypothetical protein n=1 Tax=Phyllobacterium sp. SB3 TaxID=3156073 RepID=UPI0032AEF02C